MSEPRRRLPTWLIVSTAVLGGVALFWAMDWWVYGRDRAPRADLDAFKPLRLEDVGAREALLVELTPGGEDEAGLPQVAVRFRDCTWWLAHPGPDSTIPEASAVWNRLAPSYESVCASFADAVRGAREEDPERRIGVIRTRAGPQGVHPAVVSFVTDAFADAGVMQVVVAPASTPTR